MVRSERIRDIRRERPPLFRQWMTRAIAGAAIFAGGCSHEVQGIPITAHSAEAPGPDFRQQYAELFRRATEVMACMAAAPNSLAESHDSALVNWKGMFGPDQRPRTSDDGAQGVYVTVQRSVEGSKSRLTIDATLKDDPTTYLHARGYTSMGNPFTNNPTVTGASARQGVSDIDVTDTTWLFVSSGPHKSAGLIADSRSIRQFPLDGPEENAQAVDLAKWDEVTKQLGQVAQQLARAAGSNCNY